MAIRNPIDAGKNVLAKLRGQTNQTNQTNETKPDAPPSQKTLEQLVGADTVKGLYAGSWQLDGIARQVLGDAGLPAPTKAQLKQVKEEIGAAIKAGKPGEYKTTLSAKDAKSETLGSLLEAQGQPIDSMEKLSEGGQSQLQQLARELLVSKGLSSPTISQIESTTLEMLDAIKKGKAKDFIPSLQPSLVAQKDNVEARRGNTFFEKYVFSSSELTTQALKLKQPMEQQFATLFSSGVPGMVHAATFINTTHRIDGDFSRAYGEEAWNGFLRAHEVLDAIPKGKLMESLNVDLMATVNKLCFTNDPGAVALLLRKARALQIGHDKTGGRVREFTSMTRKCGPFTDAEVANLKEAGCHFKDAGGGKEPRYGYIVYPHPTDLDKKMTALVDQLKVDTAKPDADIVKCAADFQRRLVALHPFEDANGRTTRLLMNRVLEEFGLPPAILADTDADMSSSPEQWRRAVAEGCARTKKVLDSKVHEVSKRAGFESYLTSVKLDIVPPEDKGKVLVKGLPFGLGSDGFLYDMNGRPHLLMDDTLVPMAQMEAYTLVRRIAQMKPDDARALLLEITEPTRNLAKAVKAKPGDDDGIQIPSAERAVQADAHYKMSLHPAIAGLLTRVADVDKLDPTNLWSIGRSKPTAESIFSKYDQMDLELWHLERGLKDVGQDERAADVRAQRGKLFDLAKKQLETVKDERKVSSENPLGFAKEYERTQYESSPLRFKDLAEAIKKNGDDSVVVWRGDWSINRFIGIGPNSDMRNKDAMKLGGENARQMRSANILYELASLQGSADGNSATAAGSQYTCTTTNLGFLANGSFGGGTTSQQVDLSRAPGMIVDTLMSWIRGKSEDQIAKVKAEAEQATKDGKAAPTVPQEGTYALKDKAGVKGTLLSVRIDNGKKAKVELHRKIFLLKVPKESLLPGHTALRPDASYHAEQEAHAASKIWPWQIGKALDQESLKAELAITHPEKEAAYAAKTTLPNFGLEATPEVLAFCDKLLATNKFTPEELNKIIGGYEPTSVGYLDYNTPIVDVFKKIAEKAGLTEYPKPAIDRDGMRVKLQDSGDGFKLTAKGIGQAIEIFSKAPGVTINDTTAVYASNALWQRLDALAKECGLAVPERTCDVAFFAESVALRLQRQGLLASAEISDWLAKVLATTPLPPLDLVNALGRDGGDIKAALEKLSAALGPSAPKLPPVKLDVDSAVALVAQRLAYFSLKADNGSIEAFIEAAADKGASFQTLALLQTREDIQALARELGIKAPKIRINIDPQIAALVSLGVKGTEGLQATIDKLEAAGADCTTVTNLARFEPAGVLTTLIELCAQHKVPAPALQLDVDVAITKLKEDASFYGETSTPAIDAYLKKALAARPLWEVLGVITQLGGYEPRLQTLEKLTGLSAEGLQAITDGPKG